MRLSEDNTLGSSVLSLGRSRFHQLVFRGNNGYQGSSTQKARGALFGQFLYVTNHRAEAKFIECHVPKGPLVLVQIRAKFSDANPSFQELLFQDMSSCL